MSRLRCNRACSVFLLTKCALTGMASCQRAAYRPRSRRAVIMFLTFGLTRSHWLRLWAIPPSLHSCSWREPRHQPYMRVAEIAAPGPAHARARRNRPLSPMRFGEGRVALAERLVAKVPSPARFADLSAHNVSFTTDRECPRRAPAAAPVEGQSWQPGGKRSGAARARRALEQNPLSRRLALKGVSLSAGGAVLLDSGTGAALTDHLPPVLVRWRRRSDVRGVVATTLLPRSVARACDALRAALLSHLRRVVPMFDAARLLARLRPRPDKCVVVHVGKAPFADNPPHGARLHLSAGPSLSRFPGPCVRYTDWVWARPSCARWQGGLGKFRCHGAAEAPPFAVAASLCRPRAAPVLEGCAALTNIRAPRLGSLRARLRASQWRVARDTVPEGKDSARLSVAASRCSARAGLRPLLAFAVECAATVGSFPWALGPRPQACGRRHTTRALLDFVWPRIEGTEPPPRFERRVRPTRKESARRIPAGRHLSWGWKCRPSNPGRKPLTPYPPIMTGRGAGRTRKLWRVGGRTAGPLLARCLPQLRPFGALAGA